MNAHLIAIKSQKKIFEKFINLQSVVLGVIHSIPELWVDPKPNPMNTHGWLEFSMTALSIVAAALSQPDIF